MHFRTRVIERRDAKERVVVRLTMMVLFHLCRLGETAMMVEGWPWKARRAAREVDGGVLVFVEGDGRIGAWIVGRELTVVLGKGRAVLPHVEEQPAVGDLGGDLLDASGELGTEDEYVDVCLLDAVGDFLGGIAEIERNGSGPALEYAEVDGQPFKTVHEQDGDLVALLHATREKQVGEAVCLLGRTRSR